MLKNALICQIYINFAYWKRNIAVICNKIVISWTIIQKRLILIRNDCFHCDWLFNQNSCLIKYML